MKNYAKVVLYAYPMLQKIGEEYSVHISNRALLSYRSKQSAEELVEYLAREIICKQRLEWLKGFLDGVLDKLDETEKTLLSIRYFSPSKNRRQAAAQENAEIFEKISAWSDSTYYRRQNKVAEKVETLLQSDGLSEELFERDFAFIDLIRCVVRFVERGGERALRKKERER